jgi:cytoskeletal protein CcmA (bactofilin family)
MKKLTLPLLLLILVTLVFVKPVSAKVITATDDSVTIAKDEIVDDDLFITADTLTIEGTVNGDLYAAAGTITFSGTVNGDLLAAGGMVNVSGNIQDDLRLAGGNINVENATVGDSLTTFGGNVTLGENTSVGGNLIFGAGNFTSQAPISRGVLGGAGNITLNSPIGKNVRLGGEKITLGPLAQINGDLIYTSEEEIILNPQATISGELKKIAPKAAEFKKELPSKFPQALKGIKAGLKLWSFLAALLVGALLLYLFPKPTQYVANQINQQLLPSLGWGFLKLLFIFPVILVLIITGIGIPLALIIVTLFAVELYLTKIFVGLCFGNWLANRFNFKNSNPYLIFTVGLLGIYLITSLPFIDFLAQIVVTLLGLGAIFLSKKQLVTSLRK